LTKALQYPNSAFVLPADVTPTVILPLSLLDEIKDISEDKLSLNSEVYRRMNGKYTTAGEPHDELVKAIKVEVTRKNADQIIDEVQDEICYIYDHIFGKFPEWTETAPYPKVLMLVAGFSAHIFVGSPLCRDMAWVGSSISKKV
jgi:hypothetical protein